MSTATTLPFVNPATGERFGQVVMATPDEVRHSMDEVRATAQVWSRLPIRERVRALRGFQRVLIDARDEISVTITQDTGKSRQDSLIEILVTVDNIDLACRKAPRWLRRTTLPSGLYLFKRFYTEPRPYGVVAVISPWNYPLLLAVPAMASALLAGNTVLLKPSEVTAATGVLIEHLVERVPELAPFVRVLHGDSAVGQALVAARPDYIFITGSVATGRAVMKAAAEHLIPLTCELGGKDAMLVLHDADVAAAAKWGAWGAFFNTGQTCVSVERVYVVSSAYDRFVAGVLAETSRLKVGYSLASDSPYNLGPMTVERQAEIVETHLADAVGRGARVLTGGRRRGMFFEPTVLVDVTPDMLVMREETFGPVMPIVKVRDETEAVRLANDSVYGLSASVWSRNLDRAKVVAQQLQVGTVMINDNIAFFGVPSVPIGGMKQSGFGRTHGQAGLMQFTQPHAYAVGAPPHPLDLATVVRLPGGYNLASGLIRLAFGTNARQRLEPIVELAEHYAQRVGHARLGLAVLGAAATLATGLSLRRWWRRPNSPVKR